ncbi:MAG: carboxypeptidase-like regulatory domain-containing protein [Bryobacteraceae bacterium]
MKKATFAIALALLCLSPLAGQETRSMIYGRVLDPQGTTIAAAGISITNVDTGVHQSLKTNDTGYYEAPLLLPGSYEVTGEAEGFKKLIRKGITLPVSTRLQVDLQLEIGAVTDSISVTADAPLLETNAVSAGRVMDNKTMMNLPALGNNPALLVMLTPGIQAGGVNKYNSLHTLGGASDYSAAGKVGGNEFSIDGAPNSRGRGPSYLPVADSLQEFKVETSRFDASIGHTTGVNISMMTKAGTNDYHGTATEQHWQQRWNGTPFFVKQKYYRDIAAAESAGNSALANQLRSQDKQGSGHSNTYTATIGGPVRIPKLFDGRNKLFFFLSYAGFRDQKRPEGNLNRTVATLANREGDFSRLLNVDATRYQIYDPLTVQPNSARPTHFIRTPFAGNVIPRSRIQNPAYNGYLKFIPNPNNELSDSRLEPSNNYLADRMPFDWKYWALANRADYQLSNAHRFFFSWNRYSFWEDGYDWTYETIRGLSGDGFDWGVLGGTTSWVYTMNSATVLDVMVAGSRYKNTKALVTPFQFKPSDVGLPKYMDDKAGDNKLLPQMNFAGYNTIGPSRPALEYLSVATVKANLSHIRGKHTLRTGIDFRQHYRSTSVAGNLSGSFNFNNFYTRRDDDTFTPAGDLGHSWAAFLLGLPTTSTIDTADSAFTNSPYYAVFFQDDWRLTSKLSLNLGLRAEYEIGPRERFNRAIGYFNPTLSLPISDAARAAYGRNPVPELAASNFAVNGGSVYPGVGGAPRSLVQSELMWLPRVGVAYLLRPKTVLRAGWGTYFDTWNVHNFTISQQGFSRTTSNPASNDFGMTWVTGDPARGVSPLTNPFPVRADGTRFDEPVKDALGAMAVAGRSYNFNAYDSRRSRQQRWRFGVQQQLGNSLALEVAYAGSYSDRVYVSTPMNPLPGKYWANGQVRDNAIATNLNSNVTNPFLLSNFSSLANSSPLIYRDMAGNAFFNSPTIRKELLLRPFPQMSGLTQTNSPLGAVKTHEMQISLDRRFARGFSFNAGYTWMSARASDFYYNEFDSAPTWRESNNARPHRIVATGIYEVPFGKGRSYLLTGPGSWFLGGWQLAGTYEWQPGPLLDWGNLFYTGDPNNVNSGDRTLERWFNTDGFERVAARGPAAFHARVFPTRIDGLRADMTSQLNANLMRQFRFTERAGLQLRLDAINAINRSQFDAPERSPFSTNFGRIVAQTTATNRILQLVARIYF